jgi:hypothetical protein
MIESDPSGLTVSMLNVPFARVPNAIRPLVAPGSAAAAGESATPMDAIAATIAASQILRGIGPLFHTGAAGDTWVEPRTYTH